MALLPSFFMVQLAFAPLPPFMANALSEIEIETSIEGPAMFRLHFDLSRNFIGDFDAIAVDLFRPLFPIRISLSFGLGLPMTLINGFIRDTQLEVGNEPGTARLEVTGSDALGTMMGQLQVPASWPNMPDSSIVAAIFGKYAIVPLVTPTPPWRTILDTTTNQQGRDNAFLREIAGFHSYYLYIQPDPLAGLDIGHFKPLPVMLAFPPQGVLSIDFGSKSNLSGFKVTNEMLKPTMVLSIFVDEDTRAPVPVFAPAATDPPMALEPSLFRIGVPPIEVEMSNEAASVAEKAAQAFARVNEASRTVRASGEVDGLKFARPLLPGIPVLVRGAGRSHSGLYLVTSVTHRISRDSYTQSFQALRNAVTMTGAEVFIDPLAPVT
jgi:hypothetical protein